MIMLDDMDENGEFSRKNYRVRRTILDPNMLALIPELRP